MNENLTDVIYDTILTQLKNIKNSEHDPRILHKLVAIYNFILNQNS